MKTVQNIRLLLVLALLVCAAPGQAQVGFFGEVEEPDAEILEVYREAYPAEFYRPKLVYYPGAVDTLGRVDMIEAARLVNDRLRYAIAWTGYVELIEAEDAPTDSAELINPLDPFTELHVRFQGAREDRYGWMTVWLSTPGEQAFYSNGIHFDPNTARAAADKMARILLYQLTGLTAPFDSRICCVHQEGRTKELKLLAFDGTFLQQITSDRSIALSPSWAPDGKRIAFCSFRGGGDADLWITDVGNGEVRPLVRRSGTDAAPAWSPDGNWIVFAGSGGAETHLYMVRPDGSGLQQMTFMKCIDTSPSWSPTGRDIVFMSDRSGSPQIYRMDREGLNIIRLTKGGGYNADPAWSPAGDFIVYTRLEPHGFQIRIMDPSGGNDIPLTDEPGDHLEPSWSPDGMKITYSYKGKLWVMNVDGLNSRQLLNGGLMSTWSPMQDDEKF